MLRFVLKLSLEGILSHPSTQGGAGVTGTSAKYATYMEFHKKVISYIIINMIVFPSEPEKCRVGQTSNAYANKMMYSISHRQSQCPL